MPDEKEALNIDRLRERFQRLLDDPMTGTLGELGFGTQELPVSGADIQDQTTPGPPHLECGELQVWQAKAAKRETSDRFVDSLASGERIDKQMKYVVQAPPALVQQFFLVCRCARPSERIDKSTGSFACGGRRLPLRNRSIRVTLA